MKQGSQTFKVFADANFTVAENPLWNETEQMLYWKGWLAGRIYRKALNRPPSDFETFHLPIGKIGGFVFTKDGSLLIFASHGRVWHWRPGNAPVKIAEMPGADDKTYFNDLIADPEGRVFVGVLGHDFFNKLKRPKAKWGNGSLWRFDVNTRSFHCIEPQTGYCPNGMGFSSDLKRFYFAVTDENTVYCYDYNRATGELSNRKPFLKSPCCDGMTVDAEDCLWIAEASGNALVRYSPQGKLLTKLNLPARGASSLTFGGVECKTIFATASDYPKGSDSSVGAGGVFLQEQDVKGVPEFLIPNI